MEEKKMNTMKTALAIACALVTTSAAAEVEVNVIGNLGITTQSKTLEAPFWNEDITAASAKETEEKARSVHFDFFSSRRNSQRKRKRAFRCWLMPSPPMRRV